MSSKPASQHPPGKGDLALMTNCNIEKRCLELEVTCTKPGWCVRSVMLFSDGVFPKEGSFAVHTQTSTNKVTVPISKEKNTEEQIIITFLLGAGLNAPYFLTHREPSFILPKFAFFRPLKTNSE
jgi:hypothetical protein